MIALGESHTPDVSFFASIHENKKQRQQTSRESPDYSIIVDEACDVEVCGEDAMSV